MISAAGPRRKPPTLPMAESSTRSTSPATRPTWRSSSRACVNQVSFPVSGWRLASPLRAQPYRPDPACGPRAARRQHWPHRFWAHRLDPRTLAALRLSFGAALIAAAINTVFGLLLAGFWCATAFPAAASSMRPSICPLPCRPPWRASPWPPSTRPMAGSAPLRDKLGFKIAFTPVGVVLALVFIGLPFVVRTVQPVLEEVEREIEEVAALLGASRLRTVFPGGPAANLSGTPHRLHARFRARHRRIRLGHLHRRQHPDGLGNRPAAHRHQARGIRLSAAPPSSPC